MWRAQDRLQDSCQESQHPEPEYSKSPDHYSRPGRIGDQPVVQLVQEQEGSGLIDGRRAGEGAFQRILRVQWPSLPQENREEFHYFGLEQLLRQTGP
jgi:hypothetical protein